jgi:quercetin dioxygenase-like cupin family protein
MKNKNGKNQSVETEAHFLDAAIAAPEQHRVVFENERVRITDFRVKPGETVPAHTHRWASVNYVLSLSDFLSYDGDGNLKLDSRTGKTDIKEGSAFCLPPFPPTHSVENIGETDIHAISVELKD